MAVAVLSESIEKSIIRVKHEECIELNELSGMVILNVDNLNRVMSVEVLDRRDVYSEIK